MPKLRLALQEKGSEGVEQLLDVLRAAAAAEGWTLDLVHAAKGSTCAVHGVGLVCPSCTAAERGRKGGSGNKGRTVSPERAAQLREFASRPRPGRKKAEGANT